MPKPVKPVSVSKFRRDCREHVRLEYEISELNRTRRQKEAELTRVHKRLESTHKKIAAGVPLLDDEQVPHRLIS